jgi:hypothetical protein
VTVLLLGGEESRTLRGVRWPSPRRGPAPGLDVPLRLAQRREVMLVEALIPPLAVEAHDEAVLYRPPRADEVEPWALGRP